MLMEQQGAAVVERYLQKRAAAASLKGRLTRCLLDCNPTKVPAVDRIIEKMKAAGASEVQLFSRLLTKYQEKATPFLRQQLHLAISMRELMDWIGTVLNRPDIEVRASQVSENGSILDSLRTGELLCQLAGLPIRPVVETDHAFHFGKAYFDASDNIQRFLSWARQDLGWSTGELFDIADLLEGRNDPLVVHRLNWVTMRLYESGRIETPPPAGVLFESGDPYCKQLREIFPLKISAAMGIALLTSFLPQNALIQVDYIEDIQTLRLSHPSEHPIPIEMTACVLQGCLVARFGAQWELVGRVVAHYLYQWDHVAWRFPHVDPTDETVSEVDEERKTEEEGSVSRRVFPAPVDALEQTAVLPSANRRRLVAKTVAGSIQNSSTLNRQESALSSASGIFGEVSEEEESFMEIDFSEDPQTLSSTGELNSSPSGSANASVQPQRIVRITSGISGVDNVGRGSYGAVYVGMDMARGSSIAVKVIPIKQSSAMEAELAEFALLSKLKHKNIIRYFGSALKGNCVCLGMEYASGGTLLSTLERYAPIPPALAVKFILELASGLQYLHSQGVVHRDLKPANILVRGDGSVAIADFGCSRVVDAMGASKLVGTPQYMAPEVAQNEQYSFASDMWAFGCCVVELCIGCLPWSSLELEAVALIWHIANIKEDETPFSEEQLSEMESELRSVVLPCFAKDPQKRPSFPEVIEKLQNLCF